MKYWTNIKNYQNSKTFDKSCYFECSRTDYKEVQLTLKFLTLSQKNVIYVKKQT